MYMFLKFFFALVDNNQLKMRPAGSVSSYTRKEPLYGSLRMLIASSVFHQIISFSGKIVTSRIPLRGSAISKLSTTTKIKETRK